MPDPGDGEEIHVSEFITQSTLFETALEASLEDAAGVQRAANSLWQS